MYPRKRWRCSALWVAAAACLVPGTAAAGDWSLRTAMLERLSANDNVNLVPERSSVVYGAYSELQLILAAKSHTYDFSLDGRLGYQAYFGDSADRPEDRYLPSLSTSYLRRGKTTDFTFNASYVLTPATEDTGLLIPNEVGKGDRQTMTANSSVIHRINARNDLTVSARATRIDFIDGSIADTPNTSVGGSIVWKRRATKRTDFTLSDSLDYYVYEDQRDQKKLYNAVRAGFSTRLSKRLTVNASGGLSITDTYLDSLVIPSSREHTASLGTLADFGLAYQLKTGVINSSVSYGLTPDVNGELNNALTFGAAITYNVNDLTQAALTGQYRMSDGAAGDLANTSLSISPSLSYTLARDWRLSASYQFAMTDDEDGKAVQNAVFMTLSRNYVLLP